MGKCIEFYVINYIVCVYIDREIFFEFGLECIMIINSY